MHRDLKLGLALAVLLIGATTAFFFRSETDPGAGLPQLQNPERLDVEIAGRDVIPYLGEPESDAVAAGSPWTKPAFLGGSSAPIRRTSVTPDPIRILMEEESELMEPGPALPSQPEGTDGDVDIDMATEPQPGVTGGQTHIVQPGETLSGLAAKYLGSITRFGEIYDLNRDRLGGPNDLRVGMELRIPPRGRASTAIEQTTDDEVVNGDQPVAGEETPEVLSSETTAGEPSETAVEREKLFVPARRTPFVPSRYRSGSVPSAAVQGSPDPDRE